MPNRHRGRAQGIAPERSRLRMCALALMLLPACGGGGADLRFEPDFFSQDRRVHPVSVAGAVHDQPVLCCDRGRVYVAWREIRGPGDERIGFNRSTNGGASFSAMPRRLDTGGSGFGARTRVQMCCDGLRVYVAWLDSRNGRPDVRFNRSLDGGLTWLGADVRVNTNLAGTLTHTGLTLCCEDDRVHIAYVVVENRQLLAAVSTTAGTGFSARPVCVHALDAVPAEPNICCDDGEVYLAWADFRDGEGDIYVNRSADGGTTWQPDGLRIDRGTDGAADSRRPRLCCQSRRVYAVWDDARAGRGVFFNRSVDGASTWRSTDRRMDGLLMAPTALGGYDVCCEGGAVHVAWTDNRSGGSDLFVRTSDNSGLDFGAETRLDPGAAGASASVRPRLSCCGRNVFAAWVEGSPENVWFSYSVDAGTSWTGSPLRMNTVADAVHVFAVPALCCSGRNVYVAWRDGRTPPEQHIRLTASRP